MPKSKTIGELLMYARVGKADTKKKAGQAIGVRHDTIADWELGLYLPSDRNAQALATYLGMDLGEVLTLIHREKTNAA